MAKSNKSGTKASKGGKMAAAWPPPGAKIAESKPLGEGTLAYLKAKELGKGGAPAQPPKVEADGLSPEVRRLLNTDPEILRKALMAQNETKRAAVQTQIDALRAQMESEIEAVRTVHMPAISAKVAELRALGFGDVGGRRSSGGSINSKGATAQAILSVLKAGPMRVKDMESKPEIQAVMEGKYARSFMAVSLAAMRDKGLVEQTGERGVWRLTEAGQTEAKGGTAPIAAAA